MIYIIPQPSNENSELGRLCFVCRSLNHPAIVAFIKFTPSYTPDRFSLAEDLVVAVEKFQQDVEGLNLNTESNSLFVDVVILRQANVIPYIIGNSGGELVTEDREEFDSEFLDSLSHLSTKIGSKIFLSGVPVTGLPIKLNSDANNTVMLYRNRIVIDVFENVSFEDRISDDLKSSRTYQELFEAIVRLVKATA